MGDIVANIAEYSARVDSRRRIPVPEEHSMGKLPERSSKYDKQCRRHDKPKFVHGEVMMDSVEKEMESESHAVVREIPTQISQHPDGKGGA
jgi:hypothetical protein